MSDSESVVVQRIDQVIQRIQQHVLLYIAVKTRIW